MEDNFKIDCEFCFSVKLKEDFYEGIQWAGGIRISDIGVDGFFGCGNACGFGYVTFHGHDNKIIVGNRLIDISKIKNGV